MGIYSNTYNAIDELADVRPSNIIPDGCLSFNEAAMYVCEGIENAYNDMMHSIGVHELAVFESTGNEIIYEADEKVSLGNKIVNFFKQVWSHIKALFEKAVNWVRDKVSHFNAAISEIKVNRAIKSNDKKDKISNKIAGKISAKLTPDVIDAIPEGKKLGVSADYDRFLDKIGSSFKRYCMSTPNEVLNKVNDDDDGPIADAEDFIKNATGYDVKTASEFSKKLSSDLKDSERAIDKGTLKKIGKEISDYASNGNGFINDIKKPYQDSKKAIDNCIKDWQSFSKKNKSDKFATKNANDAIRYLKDYSLTISSVIGALIQISKQKYIHYSTVAMNAIRLGNQGKAKAKAEEAKNESATFGNSDFISEAFDW